jgi:hypothetical protein
MLMHSTSKRINCVNVSGKRSGFSLTDFVELENSLNDCRIRPLATQGLSDSKALRDVGIKNAYPKRRDFSEVSYKQTNVALRELP